ncbi:VCBS repeat-containing protein [Lewinella sp. JB7]|uniref:FG-GAP repeat domain-containing protein n=1 Tax=Lewinella sp. JB7 TaxID=2962887 RepID=UPI0020C9B1C9|nr:VCBS repeat-containing protein [Lewinella sp. JB7]MCP9237834.1 VCBS repeat-containing protein [Lewinella sp. JB7]
MNHAPLLLLLLLLLTCADTTPREQDFTQPPVTEVSFTPRVISTEIEYMWAFVPAEVSGDDIMDLVLINGNNNGGPLQYLRGQLDTGAWELVTVATAPPGGGEFAAGDLEAADMDGDGDTDIFAVKHPGEWMDAAAPAELFWYENPGWAVHAIGRVPNAVKDVNFADFDQDGRTDLAVLTFEENTLSVFRQEADGQFARVAFYDHYGNLHEGMATGDVTGDGRPDVIANGYVFSPPAGGLDGAWTVTNIAEKWNNQPTEEGRDDNWSRNGTKHFARDLDGDGTVEIFVSHSERAGYPLVFYRLTDDGKWEEHVIAENIPAAHTLQVFDFDGDGDQDVLSGINRARAVNIAEGVDNYHVTLYLNDGRENWTARVLGTDGIYNGQAADFDYDGDIDIFRYPDHEATFVELWVNR